MSDLVRALIRSIFLPLIILMRFTLNRNSILRKTGWVRSYIQRKPIDAEGNALPWMNYAAIDFLKKRLHADIRLFEWGSGYSTLFFASRVKSIVSVEYNEHWFNLIKQQVPSNVEVRYRPLDSGHYVSDITTNNETYHLIVIDGRERVKCFAACLEKLHETGVILLDDSDRNDYQAAFALASAQGFRHIDFIGLKPRSHKQHQTTVFYKTGNCMGI